MASESLPKESSYTKHRHQKFQLEQYIPILNWGRHYKRADLTGDLLAGIIVAVMLVPQGMAYAMLAGLPPEVGLYASIVPLIIYGVLGTSRALAVGPVALVSLLVATGVSSLAEPGTAVYWQLALTLAFMIAIIQTIMGFLRVGFLVNFLSHPVLTGFTSSAAILIGFSQLKHVLGISIPRFEYFHETVGYTLTNLASANLITVGIGVGAIIILLYFKYLLGDQLTRAGVSTAVALPLTKAAPLVVVVLGTLLVWALGLDTTAGVSIVGDVPAGLPPITTPSFDLSTWQLLLPTALAISLVGYMESVSVAKSLASKKRQKIDANQELVALGFSNIGSAFTGGYPVTGGISRSVVNFTAGANTGLASIITAGIIAITVMLFTPIFYYLPSAILAAIIIVAVAGMVDLRAFRHVWAYSKADGLSMLVTFTAVLAVGVEQGIIIGVVSSLILLAWRISRPHVAIVGRVGESEIYRNIMRHQVETWPRAVAMRVDESLYFANATYLEELVMQLLADEHEMEHFVFIGTAVNFIDASALETLEEIHHALKDAGVTFHLAAIKGPVMDRLRGSGLIDDIGLENVHLSTHDAMQAIGCVPASS
jgi:SulP family sulfate permease